MASRLDTAIETVRTGDLVVYPTETVYGLGADALDPEAIERVFEAKRRPRDDPLSMGVPDIATALEYTDAGEVGRGCLEAFLPGPVTVICKKAATVPEKLTGGRDRVGIRIPDHAMALELLEETAPITATSANRSGAGSVTRPDQLDPALRRAVGVVLDGGETPGAESTVVDPEQGVIRRRGAMAAAVEAWLDER